MMVTSSASVVGAESVGSAATAVRGEAERISVAIDAAESPGFVGTAGSAGGGGVSPSGTTNGAGMAEAASVGERWTGGEPAPAFGPF